MILTGIGVRVTPKEIYYSVIENNNGVLEVKSLSKLIVPVSLSTPEQLNFVRKTFKDIIFEFGCNRAGIRITEDSARTISVERVSYEAVIQELLASSTIEKYLTGKISNMCPRLGIGRKDFKLIVENKLEYDLIDGFSSFNPLFKESILVCIASFAL